MDSYRLFFIERGQIIGATEFDASSERTAVEHAEDVRRGRAAELRSRARVVRTFAADTAW